eukprot:jgi/Chlat1/2513/Chrsp175S02432
MATATASHADPWAFLEDIEAPRWADLLAEAGEQVAEGHDPWFDVSHPVHQTPLFEEEASGSGRGRGKTGQQGGSKTHNKLGAFTNLRSRALRVQREVLPPPAELIQDEHGDRSSWEGMHGLEHTSPNLKSGACTPSPEHSRTRIHSPGITAEKPVSIAKATIHQGGSRHRVVKFAGEGVDENKGHHGSAWDADGLVSPLAPLRSPLQTLHPPGSQRKSAPSVRVGSGAFDVARRARSSLGAALRIQHEHEDASPLHTMPKEPRVDEESEEQSDSAVAEDSIEVTTVDTRPEPSPAVSRLISQLKDRLELDDDPAVQSKPGPSLTMPEDYARTAQWAGTSKTKCSASHTMAPSRTQPAGLKLERFQPYGKPAVTRPCPQQAGGPQSQKKGATTAPARVGGKAAKELATKAAVSRSIEPQRPRPERSKLESSKPSASTVPKAIVSAMPKPAAPAVHKPVVSKSANASAPTLPKVAATKGQQSRPIISRSVEPQRPRPKRVTAQQAPPLPEADVAVLLTELAALPAPSMHVLAHAGKPSGRGTEPERTRPERSKPGLAKCDSELTALLAEHNRKFQQAPQYQPRLHSTKDVKAWEDMSGLRYYKLDMADRERANRQIGNIKREAILAGLHE